MSQERPARDTSEYEGLVFKTAQMFYERVGLELDDMRQELRVKVIKALRSYDPKRSAMSERAYVYACLANLIKDLKRDAARRAQAPLSVTYVEDYRDKGPLNHGEGFADPRGLNWFEYTFCHATHEQIFGEIEDGFVMPTTVTPRERRIVLLLVVGYDQTEIARQLGVERWLVVKEIGQLREKLADFKPSTNGNGGPPALVKGDRRTARDGLAHALVGG